jgi:hypothetical protein
MSISWADSEKVFRISLTHMADRSTHRYSKVPCFLVPESVPYLDFSDAGEIGTVGEPCIS